jgi:outer membrane protein, heavy metal efflux system
MKLKLLPWIALSLLLVLQGQAVEMSFTLEAAVRHALTNNADLAAARLGVDEAKGRLEQAGRWSNPELETEIKPNVRRREGSFTVGFTQKFPLTSRLRLERTLSRAQVAVAEAEVREFERRLALEVRTTGVRLVALENHAALKARQLENSRALGTALRKLVATGEGSELEAAQLELEAAQLTSQKLQTDSDRAELTGQLRLLLALPAGTELRLEETLSDPHNVAEGSVDPAKRTDYLAAQARVEVANQGIELARANRWEDASFGLFGEVDRREDAPDGLKTDGMVGIRFSLPLPLWNKGQGRVTEAAATAAREEKEADALALRIRSEAAIAGNQMNTAARLAKSVADDLLPKARHIEERLAKLHAEGQAPFTEVLRARERRLQLEASELDARRDYHLARVRHLAATGSTLSPNP